MNMNWLMFIGPKEKQRYKNKNGFQKISESVIIVWSTAFPNVRILRFIPVFIKSPNTLIINYYNLVRFGAIYFDILKSVRNFVRK